MVKIKEKIEEVAATLVIALMIYWDDIKETLVTCLVTVIVTSLLTNFFFRPVVVDGTSMNPTLVDRDVAFSSIITNRTRDLKRFDIVVIILKERDERLVKRVIGLPNETIVYSCDHLYIDGVEIAEDFLDREYIEEYMQYKTGYFTNDFTYTLGENEYFCMGDNRRVSQDSRYYGPFSRNDIISVGIFRIYPFSSFGKAK